MLSLALSSIKSPVVSVSKLRTALKEVTQISKETSNGVYVFNNNQPEAVVLEPTVFQEMVQTIEKLEREKQQRIQEDEVAMVEFINDPSVKGYKNASDFKDAMEELWENN